MKGRGKHHKSTQQKLQAKEKFRSQMFLSSPLKIRNLLLPPKGRFLLQRPDPYGSLFLPLVWITSGVVLLWSLLIYNNRVRRTSEQTEDKVSGDQSKLLELSLNFRKQSIA